MLDTTLGNNEIYADEKYFEQSIGKYEALKNWTIDLLGASYTMNRLIIDTHPEHYRGDWGFAINTWLTEPEKTRVFSRYAEEKPLCFKIESALEQLFETLDKEAKNSNLEPVFALTTVSKNEISGLQLARKTKEIVEINMPAGSGKTFTADYYIAQCRKKEGFDCPIWKITLSETNNNLRQILFEVANVMHNPSPYSYTRGFNETEREHVLCTKIENMAAEKRNGLLIIDEAQNLCDHLRGATQKHGLVVINQLRAFTDKNLFGIALLSNGEVLKMAKNRQADQIIRRMEAYKMMAGKPTQEDVELIMGAWNVSGKPEREWSIKIGTGAGGIGALTAFYRASLQRYGKINFDILSSLKRV